MDMEGSTPTYPLFRKEWIRSIIANARIARILTRPRLLGPNFFYGFCEQLRLSMAKPKSPPTERVLHTIYGA